MPSSPLFCLKLDLYYHGSVPEFPRRLEEVSGIEFVETSPHRHKDRFFLERMPVHVEYKSVSAVNDELSTVDSAEPTGQVETTYGLFRLYHGIPVLAKSDWIQGVKAKLENLPDRFWLFQTRNLSSRLEHILSDLAAAHFNQDSMFFQISMAKFLETLSELLFAINRQFLCPSEELKFQIDGLEMLPTGFTGYFDSLLRDEAGFDRERRLALAKHLTGGTLALLR